MRWRGPFELAFLFEMMTNTIGHDMDEARLLAWIAITWLAMRALSSCTFAVFECNFVAFRAVAVQVQTRSEATTPRRCWDAGSGREQSAKAAASSRPRQKGMFASSIHDIGNFDRCSTAIFNISTFKNHAKFIQAAALPQYYPLSSSSTTILSQTNLRTSQLT